MRIVDERKQNANLFKEVQVGQVFYVEDEAEYGCYPYMRIFKIEDVDNGYYNAVDLETGGLTYLNDNEPVILCSATLKIY